MGRLTLSSLLCCDSDRSGYIRVVTILVDTLEQVQTQMYTASDAMLKRLQNALSHQKDVVIGTPSCSNHLGGAAMQYMQLHPGSQRARSMRIYSIA